MNFCDVDWHYSDLDLSGSHLVLRQLSASITHYRNDSLHTTMLPDADSGSMQPTSAMSSSPKPSLSATRQPPAPSYLSARSADVILSEVRPTRIKSEALRSVNVLLDEILWLILGCARSLATDRLRTGLLKVLPTGLGKDALLEAEVELRAYIERNPPTAPQPTDELSIQKFPLQQAFELLRMKCEAYSSLGDQEEDIEAEVALHARMAQVAGDATPQPGAVAPAALYLTAILEHICEHVLSNVGRVVARDSSRSTAHSQDLYVALCEDESIYSLFKTMKVQDQIEQQSKASRPRRSKSFSRNDPTVEVPSPGTSTDTPAMPKARQSFESSTSNGLTSNQTNRISMDKSHNKPIFKAPSRTTGSNGNITNVETKHRRSSSLLGDKKTASILPEGTDANADNSPADADDDGSMQDFDDLMRSGTTMKVSLTPDRLKTFEVFAKEKHQRANRPPVPTPTKDISSPPSSFPNGSPHLLHKASQPPRGRNQVESIAEAPEGETRSRSASITNLAAVEKPITSLRSRSFTDARAPPVRPEASLAPPGKRTDSSEPIPQSKHAMPVTIIDSSTGIPKRTRHQTSRNRESIDLDDIMDGSEEDIPVIKKNHLTPKSAQTTMSGTRELMDFLSEGPPDPPSLVTSSSTSALSESRVVKQGRFRTIVSRLTGGSSTERLSLRAGDEFQPHMDPMHRTATLGANGNYVSTRAQQTPLHSKRSVPNVTVAARPTPPPVFVPSVDNTASTSDTRTRQPSLNRKAVPAWNPSMEGSEPPISPRLAPTENDSTVTGKSPGRPPVPAATQPSSERNAEPVSPVRKRVPRDIEPTKPTNGKSIENGIQYSPVSTQPSALPVNGHAQVDQEPVNVLPRVPPKSDRRPGPSTPRGLVLSIPSDEHVRDFRRLLARATSAEECRVLVDLFLAKCGAFPKDEAHVHGPITPPVSPIRTEMEDQDEKNLIEVLLGDGALLGHGPLALSDSISSPGNYTHTPLDKCSPQPQASPITSPSPVSVSAT
ncbi:hypothetical protein K439DRAFT_20493 [Ramaria rubella]|nr:hypothetical protein K439DRAFT_20493 [Ramaria rubella]